MDTAPLPAVRSCSQADREAALRVLYDSLPLVERDGLVETLRGAAAAQLEGLLVAYEGPQLVGAVWVQPQAGNGAVVWGPGEGDPHAAALLAAAAHFVDRRGFALAQTLRSLGDARLARLLPPAGFPLLAELAYLFAPAIEGAEPVSSDASPLTFHGGAGRDPERLAALLQRTYEGSLDCPALDGARSVGDALASYAAQGTPDPEHWFRVTRAGVDAGVLLLAAHPESGNWELVYMGVVPEFRGVGLGEQIVRHALSCAARGGAERVVLAVDAANAPALRMYGACGFREWERRRVYARLATPRSTGDRGES
ncbi:MAG: GNAT family N-acetyltransferase [Pirellulales bacterium]|nr:GNAT family N-acetyltransferase [Pirellulales bacterium]